MRYLVVVVAGLVAFALASQADVVTIEQIICKVNGEIVTNIDLEHDRADLEKQLRANGYSGKRLEDALREETPNLLRTKIDNLLLVQKGKEMELKVDADVNKQLADIQRTTNTADPEKFQALVKQETGKSYEDFKQDLKNNFYVQGVISEEVMRKIQFKTEEVRAYYDSHKDEFQREERVFLREITVSTQGKQDDPVALAAAQKKAKDLVDRARRGERFNELAQTNSDSPTAKDGGALDPYKKGELAPAIEAAVWDKERGTVTDPINIGQALLILRVDEHYKAGLASFEEVETQIQNRILDSRRQVALRAYLTKLRDLAFLEIKEGFQDTGAAPGKDTKWSDPAQLKPETVTKEQVLENPTRKKVLGLVPIPGTNPRILFVALGVNEVALSQRASANQTVQGTFLVSYKDVRQKKSGDPYLSLTLTDRSGEMDAKMWDNAAEAIPTFERDDFVRIKGLLQIFQNRPQLTLHKIQPVPESEIDLADYLPASKRDRNEMFREVQGYIAGMSNPHLKHLLELMFADEAIAQAYRTAPAAKTVHHNWIGGLIEHVLSLCSLAKSSAANYPHIDFDLLLTGVLLHDIGKIHELHYARSFGYTTEGQLLGHIQIGTQMVLDKMRLMPDFPPRLRELVVHMILSHHGELAFGSPKLPLFPEALLLHLLDNMDSKMECMRSLIDRDPQVKGEWTGYNSALDRSALKKSKYLEGPSPEAVVEAAIETAAAAKPAPRAAEPASAFADKLKGALGGVTGTKS